VVERYTYDPYGRVDFRNPDFTLEAGGSQFAWVYLHQGGRLDPSTGFYNFRNREYSPTLGRWLQVDPTVFEGGDSNLYRSDSNNPQTLVDPFGLAPPQLEIKQTDDPSPGVLGEFLWPAKWHLTNGRADASKGGYIIQLLNVTFNYEKKPNKNYKNPIDDGNWTYFEAWRVLPKEADSRETNQAALKPILAVLQAQKRLAQLIPALGKFIDERIKFFNGLRDANDVYGMLPFAIGSAGTVDFRGLAFYVDCMDEKDIRKYGFISNDEAVNKTHAGRLLAVNANTLVKWDKKRMEAKELILEKMIHDNKNVSLPVSHNISIRWNGILGKNPQLEDLQTKIISKTP